MPGRTLEDLIRDLLDEGRAGPPPESLGTEFLSLRVGPTASRLYDLLGRSPTEAAKRNIPVLLAQLAARDDRWARVVKSSLRAQGRCPRGLRATLRGALTHGEPVASAPLSNARSEEETGSGEIQRLRVTMPKRGLHVLGRREPSRIRLTTAATKIDGLGALVDALHRVDAGRGLVLDVTGVEHLYVAGLAVVGAWCWQNGCRPEIAGAEKHVEEYLERIGFADLLEGRRHAVREEDFGWRVAFAPVAPGDPADRLAAEIVEICDVHGFVGRADRSALVVTFAELIENVQRHAGKERRALVAAQYYPKRRRMTAIVVDTGMGILGSFLGGTNEEAKARIRRGENPLRLAVLPLVTSRPVRPGSDEPGHAGYGLYVVSEIAVRNGGCFRLTSGEGSLTLYRDAGARHRARTERHMPWQGTVVTVLFDLDNLLPLSEVYRTLPPPEGYTEADFFDG